MDETDLPSMEPKIIEMIMKTPTPGRSFARNAIAHIEKAAKIATIDPEMAAFRALTAEEEAATAIIMALKRRAYEGASKIKWQNHQNKWALSAFVNAVIGELATTSATFTFHCSLLKEDETRFVTTLKIKGVRERAVVKPPFDFTVRMAEELPTYADRLQKLADAAGVATIQHYINDQANKRNTFLYASDTGIPQGGVDGLDEYLPYARLRVFYFLKIFLMIDQWQEKQPFVQDCLTVFLQVIGAVKPPPNER